MICRKGNKLLQGSQASPNHAAQPFPATNGEAKVFGLLSQLLDRFAPQEPQITYPETSRQPCPEPAGSTCTTDCPTCRSYSSCYCARSSACGKPKSESHSSCCNHSSCEAGICHICSLASNQADAEIAYCMYTIHIVTE